MEEFLKAVSNFGFPIVVAAYLLIRMEKTIGVLTTKIEQHTNEISKLLEKLCK